MHESQARQVGWESRVDQAPPGQAEATDAQVVASSLDAARAFGKGGMGVALAAAAASPSLPASTLAYLQRHAGNAAVARLMTAHDRALAVARALVPARWLARYEAGEHAQFGGEEIAYVNGVAIPKGNLIAMSDFYRDPEAMAKAPKEELEKLNALIERDKQARMGVPGAVAPSNQEIEDATKGRPEGERYMDLNKANVGHFAPPKDPAAAAESGKAGLDHKSLWEKYHKTALDQAHEAAKVEEGGAPPAPGGNTPPGGNPPAPSHPAPAAGVTPPSPPPPLEKGKVPQKAIVTNMFGAHYLTDAFSAGHLINKGEVMDQAQKAWSKIETEGTFFKENSFTKTVAQQVLAHPWAQAHLADKQLKLIVWDDITPQRFSELLFKFSEKKPEVFYNIFARIVHDELDKKGVEVENNKGQRWKLSGDETLNKESLEIGKQAVAESEKNLEEAAKTPGELGYQEFFKKVWDFVPRPTKTGEEFIEKVRRQFTDASDPATVSAVVELSVKEIGIAVEELTKEGRLRTKPDVEAARKAPIGPGDFGPPTEGRTTPGRPASPPAMLA